MPRSFKHRAWRRLSKRTASISGGLGDLAADRFNLFGVLDVQKLGSLRSGQRDFIAERPLATTLLLPSCRAIPTRPISTSAAPSAMP
ncbi:hypothetical protein LP420_25590 [Massilia sp. B-10]|nr:hypothetical protein LP420_25590 [Massilia sp. B-10]